MEISYIKKRAAFLSIVSNTALIILKLAAGILTGSVSIISEAIHSSSDLLASFIAFFSVKTASEPADIEHQFGHGKFEDFSGLLEGALILIAAGYIIYEAITRILHNEFEIISTNIGIAVMLISVIANFFVSSHLFKVAHKTESLALLADAEHLRTDIFTSLGVLIALILIKFTGLVILDPIIAILVALFIIKVGIDLCIVSGKNLLDTSLPKEERIVIREIVMDYMPEDVVNINKLKTRKSGAQKQIELTLAVPESLTIKEGHDLCDRIEEDLNKGLKNVNITIHLEPCDGLCPECNLYHNNSQVCQNLKNKER